MSEITIRKPSRARSVRITKSLHRWASLGFLAVLVSAILDPTPPGWIAPFMVVPIVLMLVTGIVLQVRHLRARQRVSARRTVRHSTEALFTGGTTCAKP